MKIDQTNISQSLLPGQPKKAEHEKPAIGFGDVLKQQIKATPEMSGIQPCQLQPSVGLSPVTPAAGSTEPVQTVERLLDTVEQYGRLLNDPGSTLRAMEPTVNQMKIQVTSMNRLLQNLPVENPMRQVLEETRALVSGEVERFDSGYYVDP